MSRLTPITVLYADVSGSTRLYEQHGDEAARSAVARCLEILSSVVERMHGRVLKTIGDEVMCVFPKAANAVVAANEMQIAVKRAGEAGDFVTGPLRIKIGAHFGPGIEQQTDVFGEAAIISQQLIKQGKADQILISGETFAELPPELRFGSRPFDTIAAEGRDAPVEIVEMLWEVTDLTQMSDIALSVVPVVEQVRLRVRYEDQTIELDNTRPRLTMGRTEQNDLMVPTSLASRSHAEIECRRGRYYLTDMSTNGTVVIDKDGNANHVRGESVLLSGNGRFCLGGTPEMNPEGVVEYVCI
ncbi:MAG: adenylate cyclase [Gammaproteobacteria bacterium]|jgi:adenylate cyclase